MIKPIRFLCLPVSLKGQLTPVHLSTLTMCICLSPAISIVHLSVQLSLSTLSGLKLMAMDQPLLWIRMSTSHRLTHLPISPSWISLLMFSPSDIQTQIPWNVRFRTWFLTGFQLGHRILQMACRLSREGLMQVKFAGGSQQRLEDLGHHGVSTTPSPCYGSRMTVAFNDNVAQVHTHSDLYHSSSVFSATLVTLPTGSTSTPIDSRMF